MRNKNEMVSKRHIGRGKETEKKEAEAGNQQRKLNWEGAGTVFPSQDKVVPLIACEVAMHSLLKHLTSCRRASFAHKSLP